MVTVIRPTSPLPGWGRSRAWAGLSRPRAGRRGRGMRATARACPAGLVTMTRHCAAGSWSAAWASWRAWAGVMGPTRPRVPGRSARPARVVQGGRDRAQVGPGRHRPGPERVRVILRGLWGLFVAGAIVEAVVGRGVL